MGKKSKKEKTVAFVLPDDCQWANKDHTEYWMSLNCGNCKERIHFEYDMYGSLTEPRYWHLFPDGGRLPYCDAYHAFAHHQAGYILEPGV